MTDFIFTCVYENGDKLTLGDNLSVDDIPRDNLIGMIVTIGNSQLFTLHLEPNQNLIYRARRPQSPGVDPKLQKEPTIYIVGWTQLVNGKSVQSITYICDWPGRGFQIHQAGKWKDNHPWFYKPFLKKWEVDSGEEWWHEDSKTWKIKE